MSEHTPLTEREYAVQGEWLVEYVNEHTCGTGRDGYYGAHEPGCGMEPVARIADILDALAAHTSTATADAGLRERVEALVREAECNPALTANFIIGDLRAALEIYATPASTEDRADNEGTP